MSAVSIQTSVTSSDLNAVLLFNFMMGMYTVIYLGTIYIYFTKNPSKHYLVPAAITVLFLSTIVLTAVLWYSTKWTFIDNGAIRKSVYLALYDPPPWMAIASDMANCISYVIADGLLIWRCFHVWNRSLRMISVSLLLVTAEFALFFAQVAFKARYNNLVISHALAIRINNSYAAAFFMSFGTTLVTTVLIGYRIYSVSTQQGVSSRRFKHIVDIVVQSGAVYALAQLTEAISYVVPNAGSSTRAFALQSYAQSLNSAIGGISPTVMVARVALLSEDATYPSTSVHLSGLQFHARSTHPTVGMEATGITDSIDGDRVLAGEGQVAKDKVQ